MTRATTPVTGETVEILPQHRFDAAALDAYLAREIAGYRGNLVVRQFNSGFSNPTFLLEADSETGERRRFVMRKKPPGALLASAHQVDREYKVLSALAGSAVPVPRTRAFCADDSVIGQMFYVMDCVDGRIFTDPTLPGLSPPERKAIFDSMNEILAALHLVDYRAVGLGDFGREGGYIARQVARWSKQYAAARTEDIPAMERLIEFLPNNLPEEDSTVIAHGDYRLGNLIVHPTEPRVIAVLDWELATLGHPLCDLAYNCVGYVLAEPPHGFANAPAGNGIPSREEYVAAYCRRTGRAGIADFDYYLAFSLFRLAAIAQGVYKRGLDGNAASADALSRRHHARQRAELAWRLISDRPAR